MEEREIPAEMRGWREGEALGGKSRKFLIVSVALRRCTRATAQWLRMGRHASTPVAVTCALVAVQPWQSVNSRCDIQLKDNVVVPVLLAVHLRKLPCVRTNQRSRREITKKHCLPRWQEFKILGGVASTIQTAYSTSHRTGATLCSKSTRSSPHSRTARGSG